MKIFQNNTYKAIVCIGVSTPPPPSPPPLQKHHPLFLAKPPPKHVNYPSPPPFPFLGNAPLYVGFSWPPYPSPLKIGFFSEIQIYWSLSFLNPFYLLKITKFLVKISQFEFLVMTEKNIFVYKLFLSLNISDFSSFFI